jgi:hypothetical protein
MWSECAETRASQGASRPAYVTARAWHQERGLYRRDRRRRPTRSFDLPPDGNRFALAAASGKETEMKQDKLVFVFNFFDELRRIAPAKK